MKKVNIFFLVIRPLAVTITLSATMFSAHAQSGNLGVGTNAPASKLSVNGNASIGAGYQTIPAPVDGAIIKGRVGIGNSAPTEDVEIGNTIAFPNPVLLIHSSSNNLDQGGTLKFRENNTAYGSNIRHSTGADATRTEGLYFESVNNNVPTPIMVVDQLNNRVGIGNTLPATKLDVNGAFRTRSLSPSTNGGSGNIPLGTSSFTVFNGDFVASITLPAGAPEGQRMVVYSSASSNATINTTNTSLASALTLKTGEYYEFYSNGSVWYINPAIITALTPAISGTQSFVPDAVIVNSSATTTPVPWNLLGTSTPITVTVNNPQSVARNYLVSVSYAGDLNGSPFDYISMRNTLFVNGTASPHFAQWEWINDPGGTQSSFLAATITGVVSLAPGANALTLNWNIAFAAGSGSQQFWPPNITFSWTELK